MPTRCALAYFVWFALAGAVTGLGYRLGDWAIDSARCRLHREPGTFLAYCTEPHYGFYEQGAYWFGLEPRAIEHLKKADVLFLGNSRAQFGFSTENLRNYFRRRGISYYVMGFGYGESNEFALALIEKYRLKPKLLVIDADPFFNTGVSNPAEAIFDRSGSPFQLAARWTTVRWDYLTRHVFNALQPKLCAAAPPSALPSSGRCIARKTTACGSGATSMCRRSFRAFRTSPPTVAAPTSRSTFSMSPRASWRGSG
jgi:hypothetical protein